MLRLIYMLAVTSPSIRCCFSVYEAANLSIAFLGLPSKQCDHTESDGHESGLNFFCIYLINFVVK